MRKNLKIKQPLGTNLEPQEIILDRMVQAKNTRDVYPQKLEQPIHRRGIKLWSFLAFVLLLFLIGKAGYLQIAQGEYYSQLAAKNQFLVQSIEAERGVIYDRHFQYLAQNAADFDLVINKEVFSQNPEKESILEQLAVFLSQEKNQLQILLDKSSEEAVLQKNLGHNLLLPLISKVEEWPGVTIEKTLVREYPQGEILAHILGYLSRSNQEGAAGLEKEYEETIKANPGLLLVQRDSQGNQIGVEMERSPSPGGSLVLNIDLPLQKKIDEVLKKSMEEVGSPEANAIAIDPRNGQVLALVSRPSYDNNIFSFPLSAERLRTLESEESFSFFNAAIAGTGYPTGSIIKPLLSLAALEEGIIKPETELPCPEKICLLNKYTQEETCYHDWKYHGPSDLSRALAESVNTYFYAIGGGTKGFSGLGPQKIENWLEKFGWGDYTGIDLPEEGKGILPILDQNWSLGDTYHLSIGQGPFTVTPLQVATAYVAIANGGTLYQPQIVKAIVRETESGLETTQEIQPRILASSLGSPKNLEIVREGMRQAVTSPAGSSHSLDSLPQPVASKTGTAQTSRANYYHNWIAVFGPYQEPSLVLVIMLKDVSESMVAWRPATTEILNWYFSQQDDKLE